jgi:hypothetical protein
MAALSACCPAGAAHAAHSALQSLVQRLVQENEGGWQHRQPVALQVQLTQRQPTLSSSISCTEFNSGKAGKEGFTLPVKLWRNGENYMGNVH